MWFASIPELVSVLPQRGEGDRYQTSVRVQVVVSGAASHERASKVAIKRRVV